MGKIKQKKIVIYCLIILGALLTTSISVLYSGSSEHKLLEKFKSYEPETPLIPKEVQISPKFVEGVGEKIGRVQLSQGKVYVIHFGQKIAYQLKKNNPLVARDTLITFSKSRLNAIMNDKSILALAPLAKLTLTKSEYSPAAKTRSTVMDLIWGSARFIVKKISGKSEYTVKTKTALCGVRSTDFAVSVAPADEGKKVSALNQFLALLNPVQEAHALVPGTFITTVLTGTGSTVGLTGTIGGTTIVGPTSVAGATGGFAATGAFFVGPGTAFGVLDSIGPQLASMSMPPGFD